MPAVLRSRSTARAWVPGAIALTVALAAFSTGPARSGAADPAGQVTVVATGGVTPGFPAAVGPTGIITGADGLVYFGTFDGVGRRNADGSVTIFSAGLSSNSISRFANGPDGNVWFTEFNSPSKVAKIDSGGNITEVAGVGPGQLTSQVEGIALGPDGNLWVTEPGFGGPPAVARVTPAGAVTEYFVNYEGVGDTSHPRYIAVGPNNQMWFTDDLGTVAQVDPGSGVMTLVARAGVTPGFSAGVGTSHLALGPDGNMWVLEDGNGSVARVTAAGGVVEFPIGSEPGAFWSGITVACDGNLWVSQAAEDESTSQFYRVTTTGAFTSFTAGLPADPNLFGIAVGPDHDVWSPNLGEPGNLVKVGTGCPAPVEEVVVELAPTLTG